jgi:hypothetical protein
MALELNRLDAVDSTLLQVTNIERTRAVSMAQQETVALAQVLKVSFARWRVQLENILLCVYYDVRFLTLT